MILHIRATRPALELFNILEGKSEAKTCLGSARCERKDNIITDLKCNRMRTGFIWLGLDQ
jgi:hypothetical protein